MVMAYREVLALATKLNLEYEMERMAAAITEMEDDANDRRLQAVRLNPAVFEDV
jgi:hypothetical protein